jgi:protein-S-isoprenylcysteine O-methyltransferase Ste14
MEVRTMSVLRVYGQWIVVTVMVAVVLFASAGRVDLPMFWVYLAVHSGAQLAMALLVFRRNRDLLEERQKPGAGAKAWDWRLLRVYAMLTMVLFVVAGLDVGRLHWSDTVSLWGQIVALLGFALSFAFTIWASYIGSILSWVCAALALGSWLALVPVVLIAATVVVRTASEDRALHEELAGYAEYARRVRFRLLPGVW